MNILPGEGELVVQVCRLPGPALAAAEKIGPAAVTVGHVPVHLRGDRFVVQRTERGPRVERVTQTHNVGCVEHSVHEGVVRVALDQHSLGSTADLT